jgi:hypothetical protein
LASETFIPTNFAFQAQNVATPIPRRRRKSAVERPASCSRSNAMICFSVNRDRFIVRSFSAPDARVIWRKAHGRVSDRRSGGRSAGSGQARRVLSA